MPYINDRVVHDADSHTMELPNWFDEFGTDRVKKIFKKRFQKTHLEGAEGLKAMPALHQKNQYRSHNDITFPILKIKMLLYRRFFELGVS